jgi:hypothetical protein
MKRMVMGVNDWPEDGQEDFEIVEVREGETDEQFFYKTRKKALGPFKKDIMGLAQDVRDAISSEIEAKFDFLFKQLDAVNNKSIGQRHGDRGKNYYPLKWTAKQYTH